MSEHGITRFLAVEVCGASYYEKPYEYDGMEFTFTGFDFPDGKRYDDRDNPFDPIHNIAHAFMVVENMIDIDYSFTIESVVPSSDSPVFRTVFRGKLTTYGEWEFSVSEAICQAAVRAQATDAQRKEML